MVFLEVNFNYKTLISIQKFKVYFVSTVNDELILEICIYLFSVNKNPGIIV